MQKLRCSLILIITFFSITLSGQASDWSFELPDPDMEITDAQFFDKTDGWAVGNFYGSFLDSIPKNYIVKTTNEGLTWEVKLSNPTTTDWLNGIAFPTAENGYAIGQNGQYYRSTDGGETWIAEDIGVENDLLAIQFLNVHCGYIACSDGLILKTQNGGDYWFASNFSNENDMHAIEFIDEQNGYCIGENGLIAKTTNAGLIWEILDANTTADLHGLHVASNQQVIICGTSSTIVQTTDAGATWTTATFDTQDIHQLADVRLLENDYGIATGIVEDWLAGIAILETFDGGLSWQIDTINEVFPDVQPTMSEIHFLPEDETIYLTGGLISYNVGFMVLVKADYKILPTETPHFDVQKPTIAITPNPVSHQLTLTSPNHATSYLLKILDAKGNLIFQQKALNASFETVDVSSFPKGNYFFTLQALDQDDFFQGTFIKM